MKATLLVGNGFNYFVSDYMNDEVHKEKLDKVAKVLLEKRKVEIKLTERRFKVCREILKEYCSLFEEISIEKTEEKGEFFLENLKKFTDKIEDEKRSIFTSIEAVVGKYIMNKMMKQDAGLEDIPVTVNSVLYLNYENQNGVDFSKKIRSLIENYRVKNLKVYTTNYDNIVNQVFEKTHPKAEDEDKCQCLGTVSLHGNYAAKAKKDKIICTAPSVKKKQIPPEKFEEFTKRAGDSNYIILFGLGLESDPHILEVLNALSNKRIILIEKDVQKYVEKNANKSEGTGYTFLKRNYIYGINTGSYNYENFSMQKPATSPYDIVESLERIMNKIKQETSGIHKF